MTEPSAAVPDPAATVRGTAAEARHFAVVPSAGTGSRLGADRPKQYLPLGDATILERAIAAVLACDWIERLVVVTAPTDTTAATLPGLASPRCALEPVGGDTRRDSVLGGLRALAERHGAHDGDWVWVHDAARPGVDPASLARLRDALHDERVGAMLALPVADTVKRGATERASATVPRDGLWLAQTPQVFRLGDLRHALERHRQVTDEASAIEATGRSPRLVTGSRSNFKVTTMDDLAMMRDALALRDTGPLPWRVGQGWDVHALVPGRPLVIGGVTVPHDRGLLGHSDADVLLHAVTDALLGGAGLGDIGRHFPDTDPRFAGADSRLLLREAVARVRAEGWVPASVDCTVVAQAPRLAGHVAAMVAVIAADLGLPASCVNVKAKTAERLGPEGRQEGISAQAIAMLARAAA